VWIIEKKYIKYLSYILHHELHYIECPWIVEGYSDANWIFNIKDLKSISEYLFMLEETTILEIL
jgi:hypothetical protein